MAIESVNPYTGELIKRYKELSVEEVDARLGLAESAFLESR